MANNGDKERDLDCQSNSDRNEPGFGNKKNIWYFLAGLGAVIFWGTTYALSKMVVPDPLNSVTFTAIRTALGTISLVIFLLFNRSFSSFIRVFIKHWKKFLFIGIGLYSMAYMLQYFAITHTTASNQSIIANTQTFWVVLLNYIFLKRKPTKTFILGAIVSFVGVILIILNKIDGGIEAHLLGDLLSLLTFALWGVYTFTTKQITVKERPIFISISILLWATFFLLPLSLGFGALAQISQLTVSQWIIMAYLGIFCVGGAFILWNTALSKKEIGSEYITILTMLQPVIGVLTSWWLLNETINLQLIGGLILVLIGVLFANVPPKTLKNKFRLSKIF